MGRICSEKVASTQIFSSASDSADSDFIQEHIESFFPPADSEEVIEEDHGCERRSDYRIDYVVDLVDDAVDMLVAGFAYVRDLVQTVGEMIVEWGMRVIDAIGQAFSAVRDAVSEVGEMVKNLFEWLGDWLKEQLANAFNKFIEPLKTRIENFYEDLAATLSDAYDEYEETGELSSSTEKELNSLLDFTWITVAMAGLTVAIEGIAVAAGAASFGVGYLALSLIAPFAAILAAELFTGDDSYSTMELPGLDKMEIDFDYIIDFGKDKVSNGSESANGMIMSGQTNIDVLFSFTSVLFGMWSWILTTAGTVSIPGMASTASAILGAVAWWILGIGATMFSGTIAGDVLGVAALVAGGSSLIGSILAAKFSPTAGHRGMLAMGVVFGGVAVYSGYKSLT